MSHETKKHTGILCLVPFGFYFLYILCYTRYVSTTTASAVHFLLAIPVACPPVAAWPISTAPCLLSLDRTRRIVQLAAEFLSEG